MCGRFGLFDGIDDLAGHFNVNPADLAGYAPRWNIAPTMAHPDRWLWQRDLRS